LLMLLIGALALVSLSTLRLGLFACSIISPSNAPSPASLFRLRRTAGVVGEATGP
jgi:hypothetical protein